MGVFPKEKPIGKVAVEWQAALQKRIDAQKLETVDASTPFSVAVASKDEDELVSAAAMRARCKHVGGQAGGSPRVRVAWP